MSEAYAALKEKLRAASSESERLTLVRAYLGRSGSKGQAELMASLLKDEALDPSSALRLMVVRAFPSSEPVGQVCAVMGALRVVSSLDATAR